MSKKKEKAEAVPVPKFAEGVRKQPPTKGFTPNPETGSALHEEESEQEAIARVQDRVWNQMVPAKQPYDLKCREIEDAYMGIVLEAKTNQESKVFPIVFMLVDAKLGAVLSNRPKAVFEIDYEKPKLKFIEQAYNHYTSDVDDGVNLEAVDHIWHWYNELYGWSIKRVWHEVETEIAYDSQPEEDDQGNFVYDDDGYVKLKHARCVRRRSRINQRVYDYDKVAVDPSAKFLYQADDIVFIEDIHYNQFEQMYKLNPAFKNTEFVLPGSYFDTRPKETTSGTDSSGSPATVFTSFAGLEQNRVRMEEYYCKSRCELMVKANGIPILHVPNPTPYNNLPAADLHNRLTPRTFYDRGEGHLTEPIIAIYQKLMNAKTRRVQLSAAPVVLTDTASGLSPKSVKVYPGAHWRGMKGRVEVLDLAGQDTGEVTEYLLELRNLMKIVTGNDFERLIADPDPTAIQQAARDAASRLRPEKDIKLQENIGHVRAMTLTVDLIQNVITLPELASMADLSDDERKGLQEYDKFDKDRYFKYPKIRTKGVRYVEQYDKKAEKIDLRPDRKNKGDGVLYARPQYLKTKSRVKVRAVSDRSNTVNKQVKFEMFSGLLENAFALPPKNQAEIDKAITAGEQPPKPDYFINREEAVKGYLSSIGADVDQFTKPEGEDLRSKPAQKAIRALLDRRKPLTPSPEDLPQLSVPAPKTRNAPEILPQEALA